MSPDVIPMTRPPKQLTDFLDGMSEEDLIAALDAPASQQVAVRDIPAPSTLTDTDTNAELETNSRLTIIKMFERAPEFGQHFTFCVRRFTGEAFVQAMRTTLAKARKEAREQNYDMGQEFKMIVVDLQTQPSKDVITVMRIPKGQKYNVKMMALAKMLGGSSLKDEDGDDE